MRFLNANAVSRFTVARAALTAAANLTLLGGVLGAAAPAAHAEDYIDLEVSGYDQWQLYTGTAHFTKTDKVRTTTFANLEVEMHDPRWQPERLRARARAFGAADAGVLKLQAEASHPDVRDYYDSHGARAYAELSQLIAVEATPGLGSFMDFDIYLDGFLMPGYIPEFALEMAHASVRMGYSIWGMDGGVSETGYWEQFSDGTEKHYKNKNTVSLWTKPDGGRAYYAVKVWAEVGASNGYFANFGNSVHLFANPTPGVSLITNNGFLSQQSKPEWAITASAAAPEPDTYALLATGLLGMTGVAARRRRNG